MLAEIAEIARRREVDLILICGDLFDSAAPNAESEQIVYNALLELASLDVPLVVVAGNHDNPNRLAAIRPLLELTHIHVVTHPVRADEGGVLELTCNGEPVAIALLPFLSQRSIVKADELMRGSAATHKRLYADRAADVIASLCQDLPSDAIRLFAGHLTVTGGTVGGGEREAHTVFDYEVPATAFPKRLHYVALGHLHRAQRIKGRTSIGYSGSPLQLDFGETSDVKSVNVVELGVRRPPRVDIVPLRKGKRLRTIRASMKQIEALQGKHPNAYLQILVDEPPQVGLADRVRELLPNAVDVRARPRTSGDEEEGPRERPSLAHRSPQELFELYLDERGEGDERLQQLFDELVEELHAPATA